MPNFKRSYFFFVFFLAYAILGSIPMTFKTAVYVHVAFGLVMYNAKALFRIKSHLAPDVHSNT